MTIRNKFGLIKITHSAITAAMGILTVMAGTYLLFISPNRSINESRLVMGMYFLVLGFHFLQKSDTHYLREELGEKIKELEERLQTVTSNQ